VSQESAADLDFGGGGGTDDQGCTGGVWVGIRFLTRLLVLLKSMLYKKKKNIGSMARAKNQQRI